MRAYYILSFILLIFSCKERKDHAERELLLSVEPQQIINLESQKIPIEELIPKALCRVDTFFVVLNQEEEKIIRIYQANTFRFLGAVLSKGRGAEEVLHCQEIWGEDQEKGAKIWVKAPQNFLGVLDLKTSLEKNQVCWDKQYHFLQKGCEEFLYRSVFPLKDSVFLISRAERPYQIIPSQNFIKRADGGIEILSEDGVKSVPARNMYWLKYNYSTAIASDTIWYSDYKDLKDFERIFATWECISPDRQKIAVTYDYMNQLMLMDLNTLRSKWITMESALPLARVENGTYNMHYSGVCCTDRRIFAFRAFPDDPRLGCGGERLIQIFDWEGNFKYQLNISHPLKNPFLDEEKGYLYAMDEEDAIQRYDVKAFL